jgi:hypothetical protein
MKKPTIEFDYPTPAVGKIPAFHSIEEEAEFWDTHDFTDFLEESRPGSLTIRGELRDRLAERAARLTESPAKAS